MHPRTNCLSRHSTTVLPNAAHFWYNGEKGLSWRGKIRGHSPTEGVYLGCSLDNPDTITLPAPPAHYMASTGAVRGSRCLQIRSVGSAFVRGIQRDADERRDADEIS